VCGLRCRSVLCCLCNSMHAVATACTICSPGTHLSLPGASAPDVQIQVGSPVMLRNGTQTPNVKGGPLKPGEVGIVVEFKQERVSSGDSPEDSSANTKLASASLVVLVSAGCELLQITHGHRENAHSRALVTLLLLSCFNSGSSAVTHMTHKVRAPDGSMWWYEGLEIDLIRCTLCDTGTFSFENSSSCTTKGSADPWGNDNSMCGSDGNLLCLNSVGRRVEMSDKHGHAALKESKAVVEPQQRQLSYSWWES
jgi:hypothetical protein